MTNVPVRPLYRIVKEGIRQRIIDRRWNPGDCLPNEFALGAMFEASQGTVRKALNELVAENIVVRHQGKGTFVASHTPEQNLFRFFHIHGDDGTWREPDSTIISCRREPANRAIADKLGIERGERIAIIARVRHFAAQTIIVEDIYLPGELFPDLNKVSEDDLPGALYQYYQSRFGLTVAKAVERIKAVAASEDDARILEVDPGTPLLEIERTASGLDGTVLELRVSRCATSSFHYFNELR